MSYVRTKLPNKAELQIKWSDFITIFHKIHSFRVVFGQVRSRYDAIYALDVRISRNNEPDLTEPPCLRYLRNHCELVKFHFNVLECTMFLLETCRG